MQGGKQGGGFLAYYGDWAHLPGNVLCLTLWRGFDAYSLVPVMKVCRRLGHSGL